MAYYFLGQNLVFRLPPSGMSFGALYYLLSINMRLPIKFTSVSIHRSETSKLMMLKEIIGNFSTKLTQDEVDRIRQNQ